MYYAYPDLYWLSGFAGGVATLALLVLMRKCLALRRLAQLPAVGAIALVSPARRRLKAALVTAACLLLGFVALGPQWGRQDDEGQPHGGRDVLFLLDVSRSMLSEDAAPSRLERARADALDLAASLERDGGHRVGLVAFADRAALLCPLTTDFVAFREELARASAESLRLRGEEETEDGTQVGPALRRAEQAVGKGMAPYTALVLFSDGGDMDATTRAAAGRVAQAGLTVHTVGVGDPQRASPILLPGEHGERFFLRYQGEIVRTRLEAEPLQHLARQTRGRYFAAETRGLDVARVHQALTAEQPRRELTEDQLQRVAIHRYQWFLAPAVALLLAELVLGDRSRPQQPPTSRGRYFRRAWRKHEAQRQAA